MTIDDEVVAVRVGVQSRPRLVVQFDRKFPVVLDSARAESMVPDRFVELVALVERSGSTVVEAVVAPREGELAGSSRPFEFVHEVAGFRIDDANVVLLGAAFRDAVGDERPVGGR